MTELVMEVIEKVGLQHGPGTSMMSPASPAAVNEILLHCIEQNIEDLSQSDMSNPSSDNSGSRHDHDDRKPDSTCSTFQEVGNESILSESLALPRPAEIKRETLAISTTSTPYTECSGSNMYHHDLRLPDSTSSAGMVCISPIPQQSDVAGIPQNEDHIVPSPPAKNGENVPNPCDNFQSSLLCSTYSKGSDCSGSGEIPQHCANDAGLISDLTCLRSPQHEEIVSQSTLFEQHDVGDCPQSADETGSFNVVTETEVPVAEEYPKITRIEPLGSNIGMSSCGFGNSQWPQNPGTAFEDLSAMPYTSSGYHLCQDRGTFPKVSPCYDIKPHSMEPDALEVKSTHIYGYLVRQPTFASELRMFDSCNFLCNFCCQCFKSRRMFLNHVSSHVFWCETNGCSFSSLSQEELICHVRKIHPENASYYDKHYPLYLSGIQMVQQVIKDGTPDRLIVPLAPLKDECPLESVSSSACRSDPVAIKVAIPSDNSAFKVAKKISCQQIVKTPMNNMLGEPDAETTCSIGNSTGEKEVTQNPPIHTPGEEEFHGSGGEFNDQRSTVNGNCSGWPQYSAKGISYISYSESIRNETSSHKNGDTPSGLHANQARHGFKRKGFSTSVAKRKCLSSQTKTPCRTKSGKSKQTVKRQFVKSQMPSNEPTFNSSSLKNKVVTCRYAGCKVLVYFLKDKPQDLQVDLSEMYVKQHTMDNEKAFACNTCPREFVGPNSYTRIREHCMGHAHMKPWACKYCNVRGMRPSGMVEHVKRRHKAEVIAIVSRKPFDKHSIPRMMNSGGGKKHLVMGNNAMEKNETAFDESQHMSSSVRYVKTGSCHIKKDDIRSLEQKGVICSWLCPFCGRRDGCREMMIQHMMSCHADKDFDADLLVKVPCHKCSPRHLKIEARQKIQMASVTLIRLKN